MNTIFCLILIIANLFSPFPLLPEMPRLVDFVTSVTNDNPNQLVGVYVPDLMAFPVLQQPADQPGFVSTKEGVVTQFGMAANYGTIGLLAHNYLAGSSFSNARINQVIVLIYGDGSTHFYHIYAVQRYQALSPRDPYGALKNLDDTKTYSVEEVFYNTYGLGAQNLVLQTCIASGDEDSWGRMFIMAHPLERQDILLLTSLNSSLQSLTRAFQPQAVSSLE
jgi:hypothetical protein